MLLPWCVGSEPGSALCFLHHRNTSMKSGNASQEMLKCWGLRPATWILLYFSKSESGWSAWILWANPASLQLLLLQQALNISLGQVTSTGSVCWDVWGRRGGFHKPVHQFNLQNWTAAVSAEEIPRNGALPCKWRFIEQICERSSILCSIVATSSS